MREPTVRYKLNEKETLAAVTNSGDELSAGKAEEILKSKNSEYQFIDIRTPYEFIKGHISGAVNIPLSNLLSEENFNFLKQVGNNNKSLVLYGNSQSQANAPWMLLKQLGISKVFIIQGDHAYPSVGKILCADSVLYKGYNDETARYNYAEIVNGKINPGVENSSKIVPQKVITIVKPKSSSPAAGGC